MTRTENAWWLAGGTTSVTYEDGHIEHQCNPHSWECVQSMFYDHDEAIR